MGWIITIVSFLMVVGWLIRYFELKRLQLQNQLELEKLEKEKVTEIERLRSRFYTNLSHEFRTLLTLITGPLDLLEKNMNQEILRQNVPLRPFEQVRRILSQEQARKHLIIMRNNAQLLNRLVNQLLSLADIDPGTLALKTRPVEVISLLKELVFSYAPHAHNKNISLSFHSELETLFLYLDYDKFEIIMNNLISNALKFTPPEGRIELTATRVATGLTINNRKVDCLEIQVKDTGMGMEPEHLAHIFERFYRINHEVDASPEGKGIGLAITKELVELHHGRIEVESSPAKGSTFMLRLPVGKTHLKEEEIEAEYITMSEMQPLKLTHDKTAKFVKAAPVNQPHILVVEDNAEMSFYLRSILEQSYLVSEANNGRQAWEMAVEFVPDVILSDIMMAEVNGLSLCQKLKNDRRLNHIPVILLTARAAPEDKISGLNSGADDYITKPFLASELLARLDNILKQRRELQEHIRLSLLMEPSATPLQSEDEKFIEKARKILEEHLSDSEFTVEDFAAKMAFSRFHLNRKFQAITGMSISRFMCDIRLQKAARLIGAQTNNISQTALAVGFENFSYFARSFKKKYGCTPSEYVKSPSDSLAI